METDIEPPNTAATTTTYDSLSPPYASPTRDLESNSSTPYVSAPSSPGRSFQATTTTTVTGAGFFYSAPASPMHYVLLTPPSSFSGAIPSATSSVVGSPSASDFEFSSRFHSPLATEIGCSSADELFLNGQIRPLDDVVSQRSRNCRSRDGSHRRRTRSFSPPMRKTTPSFPSEDSISEVKETETSTPSTGTTNSNSSSKRWIFIKEFLRSKSEGAATGNNNNTRFWQSMISFSSPAAKDKKDSRGRTPPPKRPPPVKGRSPHEVHYTANRAQSQEMKKKTYLPYRQGLLGCLGLHSKSCDALNGFTKALNPVSS